MNISRYSIFLFCANMSCKLEPIFLKMLSLSIFTLKALHVVLCIMVNSSKTFSAVFSDSSSSCGLLGWHWNNRGSGCGWCSITQFSPLICWGSNSICFPISRPVCSLSPNPVTILTDDKKSYLP